MGIAGISPNGGSLLAYVVSRFRPDVFTHPIWIHYRDKKEQASAETSEKLLRAANQLRNDDPKSACQILLVCAACQNRAGQHGDALKTMQQILTMADLQSLSNEILWAA